MENKSPLHSALDGQFLKTNNVIDFKKRIEQLRWEIAPEFLESFNNYHDKITEILQNVDESVREEVWNNSEVVDVITKASETLVRKGNLTAMKQSIERKNTFDDFAA